MGVMRHGRVVRNVPLADCCRAKQFPTRRHRCSRLGGCYGSWVGEPLTWWTRSCFGWSSGWQHCRGRHGRVRSRRHGECSAALGHPEPELTKAYTRGRPLIVVTGHRHAESSRPKVVADSTQMGVAWLRPIPLGGNHDQSQRALPERRWRPIGGNMSFASEGGCSCGEIRYRVTSDPLVTTAATASTASVRPEVRSSSTS